MSIYGYTQIDKNEDESRKAFEDSMVKTFKDYNTNQEIQGAFDTFQKEVCKIYFFYCKLDKQFTLKQFIIKPADLNIISFWILTVNY